MARKGVEAEEQGEQDGGPLYLFLLVTHPSRYCLDITALLQVGAFAYVAVMVTWVAQLEDSP